MKTRIESTAERKRKRHHTTMPRIRTLKNSKKYRTKTHDRLKQHRVQWSKFYGSKAWSNLRESKLIEQPLCERCLSLGRITPATCVHHKRVFGDAMSEEEQWYLFLNYENLISLCDGCHKYVHATNELGWIEHNPVVIDDGT